MKIPAMKYRPNYFRYLSVCVSAALLGACAQKPVAEPAQNLEAVAAVTLPVLSTDIYGTLEPMAEHAVYFVLTDRFVNGDTSNDQRNQGGKFPTFDQATPGGPAGETDNVGYLGGDFKGLLDHAKYIAALGFGAVWLTPIIDNPDEAFSGGTPATWKGFFTDGGKTGYHGYWGVNFFKLDEHLPSPGLDFKALTAGLKARGLKTVLDIVANHGSPAFSMPRDQPKFGEIYDENGKLIADHQNLPGEKLDPKNNPLHRFYAAKKAELAELSDADENSKAVLDYFTRAYLQWIDQGADAFRIDTIRHMKHEFWRDFSRNIRAKHPGFFMFGESFDFQAEAIAQHTLPENGGVSVLDFPMKAAMASTFSTPTGSYQEVARALYLQHSPYSNAYELMTFYDNHDMPRFAGSDTDFINAHNWLFTARGVPVIYYGSEVGFMRGTAEHAGNRNYLGADRIAAAPQSAIYQSLKRIAGLRKASVAMQRGVQLNLSMEKDRAAFLRVYQYQGQQQTALVLLNKSASASEFSLDARLPSGGWSRLSDSGSSAAFAGSKITVPANGVEVLVHADAIAGPLLSAIQAQQRQSHALAVSLDAVDASGVVASVGTVFVHDTPYGAVFRPVLKNLTPGVHGFHVHQNPSCAPGEKDGKTAAAIGAGPHFDPLNSARHGEPWGDGHLGDLPALYVDAKGESRQPVLAPRLKTADLVGRSLMLHAGGDNHADHPEVLGGGGARVACGVIASK